MPLLFDIGYTGRYKIYSIITKKLSPRHAPPYHRRAKGTMINPEDIEGVIREALSRHEVGRLEYGELDLSTDKRDFIREAEQELLDCINYCVFQIFKLRRLKS